MVKIVARPEIKVDSDLLDQVNVILLKKERGNLNVEGFKKAIQEINLEIRVRTWDVCGLIELAKALRNFAHENRKKHFVKNTERLVLRSIDSTDLDKQFEDIEKKYSSS